MTSVNISKIINDFVQREHDILDEILSSVGVDIFSKKLLERLMLLKCKLNFIYVSNTTFNIGAGGGGGSGNLVINTNGSVTIKAPATNIAGGGGSGTSVVNTNGAITLQAPLTSLDISGGSGGSGGSSNVSQSNLNIQNVTIDHF